MTTQAVSRSSKRAQSPLVTNRRKTQWVESAAEEAWNKARRIVLDRQLNARLQAYADRPVEFIEGVLHCTLTEDAKAVALSVLHNPVTIARSANALGKSHCAARIALWFYKVFPDSKVYMTAAPPLDNLKRILWGELMSAITANQPLFDCDVVRSLSINRQAASMDKSKNASFIAGWTIPTSGTSAERESKFSGKHAPHLLFIVDEGDAVPDEIYKGIEACMSGGVMARLLIMYNPRVQSGRLFHLERKGLAHVVHLSAFNHPNVISGQPVIPGAVSRETTVIRINEWTRQLTDGERVQADCFTLPEYLVGATATAPNGKLYAPLPGGWRKVVEPQFSYMVMGEYPALGEMQLISKEWVALARARWDAYVAAHGERPPQGTKPTMGLDVAEYGTDANVVKLRYGGYVRRAIVWEGMDPDGTARRALDLYLKNDCDIAMVDGTSVGSGVAPSMARLGKENNVRAISVKASERPSSVIKSDLGTFKIMRDQLWWAVREWLRCDPGAMLPPDDMLVEELLTPTYQVLYGKISVMRKEEMRALLKRSPDRADALCLTFAPFHRPSVLRLMDKIVST